MSSSSGARPAVCRGSSSATSSRWTGESVRDRESRLEALFVEGRTRRRHPGPGHRRRGGPPQPRPDPPQLQRADAGPGLPSPVTPAELPLRAGGRNRRRPACGPRSRSRRPHVPRSSGASPAPVPAGGRAWIVPGDGAVIRTEFRVEDVPGAQGLSASSRRTSGAPRVRSLGPGGDAGPLAVAGRVVPLRRQGDVLELPPPRSRSRRATPSRSEIESPAMQVHVRVCKECGEEYRPDIVTVPTAAATSRTSSRTGSTAPARCRPRREPEAARPERPPVALPDPARPRTSCPWPSG